MPFPMTPTTAVVDSASANPAESLLQRYRHVRRWSERIVEPLAAEDCVIQSMPDVSPMRWHLAHTTWFLETFVLKPRQANHQPYDQAYEYLFNSYYNSVGQQFPRARRGLLSRPTVAEVLAYRRHVDERVRELLTQRAVAAQAPESQSDDGLRVIELGLQHEQQHQELMLTDIKHVLSCNPLWPIYQADEHHIGEPPSPAAPLAWQAFEEGIRWIGHEANPQPGTRASRFAFDNESPRHQQFVHAFELANRLVTNAEFQDFIEDGGYTSPQWWLSAGWATVQEQGWQAPLYWVSQADGWSEFTLAGLRPLAPQAPVCHVSYFEADAYARWAGMRLPTEAEWEVAAESAGAFSPAALQAANFAETENFHPRAARSDAPLAQLAGNVWEWTSSSYSAYPGYAPPPGALGEYNGKFMCNQYVLRGGSCVTPVSHIRPTYRNFFPSDARWQFSGIRLAR